MCGRLVVLVLSHFRSGPYTEATGEYVRHGTRYALATTLLDVLILIFTVVVAFLLRSVDDDTRRQLISSCSPRASDIFPVRQQRFSCDDSRYYQSYEQADVVGNYTILSNSTLYLLCCCIPLATVSRCSVMTSACFVFVLLSR
jgi:uncharacterized membrane protein